MKIFEPDEREYAAPGMVPEDRNVMKNSVIVALGASTLLTIMGISAFKEHLSKNKDEVLPVVKTLDKQ